jgi:hypothetical protein
MAERDAIHQTGFQQPMEELPPDPPGQLFEILAAFVAQEADVGLLDVELQTQPAGHLANEFSVVERFPPPQAVV